MREDCSPRHVPDVVLAIDEVPRTLSGKVLELPVKRILLGQAAERWSAATPSPTPLALDVRSRASAPTHDVNPLDVSVSLT